MNPSSRRPAPRYPRRREGKDTRTDRSMSNQPLDRQAHSSSVSILPSTSNSNSNIVAHEEGEQAFQVWWQPSNVDMRTLFYRLVRANWLLVMVPLGIVAAILGWSVLAVFLGNFLALVALAPLMTALVEKLATVFAGTLGGLLNATMGNAMEMMLGIMAVARGHPAMARTSLLGSMLSYALLVLGTTVFLASYNKKTLKFNGPLMRTMSSIVMAVSTTLVVLTIMAVTSPDSDENSNLLILSHGTAIILLAVFAIYLYFQLKTHTWFIDTLKVNNSTTEPDEIIAREHPSSTLRLHSAGSVGVIATLCAVVCAFFLVASIEETASVLGTSKTFLSLVAIPFPGYAAKGISIISLGRRNRMDYVIKSIIDHILQIILFVFPLLVLLGWLLVQPFTLNFNIFEATTFFLVMIITTSIIRGGSSNYFDGIMLVGT
ncbi:uncharacterized protein BP5553_06496 [Venustampulla echinocandica]|uniref:Vacuolar calcium ion transporter n=1 Tax=Venustampulla echinocandica TaxID=2656787 RepID=A0A370TK40_9HELO|nr:uncharacterized protein BP5553_06496 [Venustampulla echinocandica]RDL35884.1 hypothetical protein BP5553_06496 [Venustampulla echinocandica]